MTPNNNKFLFISGILNFIYFIGPALGFIRPIQKYIIWIYDYDIFILSRGIYGGTDWFLPGIWPYIIQILIFLLFWYLTFKLIRFIFSSYKEKIN